MTIDYKLEGETLTVSPKGRLDSATAEDFSAFLSERFTAEVKCLILDFSEIDFISSKGLRVLVSTHKELAGRTMEIRGGNASVKEVFRVSGLDGIFNVK